MDLYHDSFGLTLYHSLTNSHYLSRAICKQVKLFRSSSPAIAIHEQKLTSGSPFVFFPPLAIDHADYLLRLESDLSSTIFQLPPPPTHSFSLAQSFTHFRLAYNPKLRPEYSVSSYLSGADSTARLFDSTKSLIGAGSSADSDGADGNAQTISPLPMLLLVAGGLVYFYYKQIFEFVARLRSQASVNDNDGENSSGENSKKKKAKKL